MHLVAKRRYEEIFSATNFILEEIFGIQRVTTNTNIKTSKVNLISDFQK